MESPFYDMFYDSLPDVFDLIEKCESTIKKHVDVGTRPQSYCQPPVSNVPLPYMHPPTIPIQKQPQRFMPIQPQRFMPIQPSKQVRRIYVNQSYYFDPSNEKRPKTEIKDRKLQKYCCVFGCDNFISQRLCYSLKRPHYFKRVFFKKNFFKICSQCYFKDRYKAIKKKEKL